MGDADVWSVDALEGEGDAAAGEEEEEGDGGAEDLAGEEEDGEDGGLDDEGTGDPEPGTQTAGPGMVYEEYPL